MGKADLIKKVGLGNTGHTPGQVLESKKPIKGEYIPLSDIVADPKNRPLTKLDPQLLRRHGAEYPFDDSDPYVLMKRKYLEGLLDLSKSIQEIGVQETIRVYIRGGKYQIIFGERRYLASILAGVEDIPSVVDKARPHNLRALQAAENMQREDTTAYERILAIKDLIAEKKESAAKGVAGEKEIRSTADLAEALWISERQARIYMALLNGPEDVIEALGTGQLHSIRKAERIAQIKDDEQRKEAIIKAEDGATFDELNEMVPLVSTPAAEQTAEASATTSGKTPKPKQKTTRGAPKKSINLGKTENIDKVKTMLQKLCNKSDLKAVDWSDFKSVQQAWDSYLKQ